jgi:hypothetical protein
MNAVSCLDRIDRSADKAHLTRAARAGMQQSSRTPPRCNAIEILKLFLIETAQRHQHKQDALQQHSHHRDPGINRLPLQ